MKLISLTIADDNALSVYISPERLVSIETIPAESGYVYEVHYQISRDSVRRLICLDVGLEVDLVRIGSDGVH